MEFHYRHGDGRRTVRLSREGDVWRAVLGDSTREVVVDRIEGRRIQFRLDDRPFVAWVAREGDERFVQVQGRAPVRFARDDGRRAGSAAPHGAGGTLTADMHGQVVAVHVSEGDPIEKGKVRVVLEAMKMEMRLVAPREGIVKRVHCRVGVVVERGQELVELGE